jgi:hypothetical protein
MTSNNLFNGKKLHSIYQWRDLYPSPSQKATIDQIENWFDDQPETGLAWFYKGESNAAEEEGLGDDFPSYFGWMLEQGTLDFSEYDEKLCDLTPLEVFSEVETLVIRVTPDSDLTPLGKLTNLTNLCICYSVNGDYSFIAQLLLLKTLEFSHCTGGRNLEAISQTQITSIRGYPVNDLTKLSSLQSLEVFNFYGEGEKGNPGIVDISPLKNLRNLKEVCVFHNNFANDTVIKEFSENCTITNYRDFRKVV